MVKEEIYHVDAGRLTIPAWRARQQRARKFCAHHFYAAVGGREEGPARGCRRDCGRERTGAKAILQTPVCYLASGRTTAFCGSIRSGFLSGPCLDRAKTYVHGLYNLLIRRKRDILVSAPPLPVPPLALQPASLNTPSRIGQGREEGKEALWSQPGTMARSRAAAIPAHRRSLVRTLPSDDSSTFLLPFGIYKGT